MEMFDIFCFHIIYFYFLVVMSRSSVYLQACYRIKNTHHK